MAAQQIAVYLGCAKALLTVATFERAVGSWRQPSIPQYESINMNSKLKPGTPAPRSGQYRNNSTGGEVTGTRGNPLPPTPKPGQGYTLVDPTKHKSGR